LATAIAGQRPALPVTACKPR